MQRNPRSDILYRRSGRRPLRVCVAAAMAMAIGAAWGQPPRKQVKLAGLACPEPPGMELAQKAGVPPTPAELLQQDEAQILALATQVHTEVSHNARDLLLLDVVRKAEQIRRLADQLKHEIKLTSRQKLGR